VQIPYSHCAGRLPQPVVIEKLPPDSALISLCATAKLDSPLYIEGHQYDYDAQAQLLSITGGRLIVSKELAGSLAGCQTLGTVIGQISIGAAMQPIEITQLDANAMLN